MTWRARTAHAQPDDLDRAIEWTDRAAGTWPPDDPNLPRAQSNLATALTDRYERDADPADLERALPLFDVAIAQLRAHGERVDVALHGQGACYHERTGYLNSLGLSLRAKGQTLADPALLGASCDAYLAAREQAVPGSDNHVAATLNLATVLQDRAEADNDVGLLREEGVARADRALLRSTHG